MRRVGSETLVVDYLTSKAIDDCPFLDLREPAAPAGSSFYLNLDPLTRKNGKSYKLQAPSCRASDSLEGRHGTGKVKASLVPRLKT